jgi:prostaglandin-H2 D-isomerase / glutathione transferase
MALKLTYFPFPGRAYIARVCFGIGGVKYEDAHLSFAELKERRGPAGFCPEFPLGSVPTLTHADGTVTIQSMAIVRYAAKLANLYPTDPLEALFVDELLDTAAEVIGTAPQNPDEVIKKKLREEWAAGKLNTYLTFFANKYNATSGPFFRGDKFSVADITIYSVLKALRSGNIDYVSTDYDSKWPELQTFVAALEADPVFSPYKQ